MGTVSLLQEPGMVSSPSILGMVLLTVAHYAGAEHGCCPEKQVSGSDSSLEGRYLLYSDPSVSAIAVCKDHCVYRKEGDDATNYCFRAGGGMTSECKDSENSTQPSLPSNEQYCSISQSHTMCQYTGIGSVCLADSNSKRGFTEAGRSLILAKHNELRSKVAKGEEPGQPKATNMRKLVWSAELEAIAQRWTDQCDYGHDTDRNKLDGTYVGQNAFRGSSSQSNTVEELMAGIDSAAQSWYDEVTAAPFDPSKIQPFQFNYLAGHYTQVVWAETEELGCGWSC